jgi:hypothetical protein
VTPVDWREFIASLVNSLAWPLAVLAVVMLLRSQIRTLFDGTLQRLKLGPAGAEFEWAQVERDTAVAAAGSIASISGPDGEGVDAELDAIIPLIETMPAVAVRRSFDVLERELRRIVEDRQLELPYENPDVNGLIRAAYHGGAITKDTGNALRGLVELRNLSEHDPSGTRTTPEKARDFLALTRSVLYALGATALGSD